MRGWGVGCSDAGIGRQRVGTKISVFYLKVHRKSKANI